MRNVRLRCRFPVGPLVAIALAAWVAPLSAAAQAPCPSLVPTSISPPNLSAPAATLIPSDVCIPASFPGNLIAFFDDYSWRAFIALVWPALSGQRGKPDPNQPLTVVDVPLVFETYKADWETFQPNGTAPSAFNSNSSFWTSNPSLSPCPQAQPGDFLLAPISKFDNVGLAGIGDLVSVLIAQNGTFVRYLAAYIDVEFNQILAKQLYVALNLPQNQNPTGPAHRVPERALYIKSAWIDMKSVAHPERYHTRKAWLVDPISGQCGAAPATVGLVGLHIVQKTPCDRNGYGRRSRDRQRAAAGLRAAASAGAAEPDLHIQRRYRDADAEWHSSELHLGEQWLPPTREAADNPGQPILTHGESGPSTASEILLGGSENADSKEPGRQIQEPHQD